MKGPPTELCMVVPLVWVVREIYTRDKISRPIHQKKGVYRLGPLR